MHDAWLEVFAKEGTARAVAANRPLVLEDADAVWLLRAGRLDLFAVGPIRHGVPGARVRLCRLEAGELLFGVGEGLGTLLAVGHPGTEVVRLGRRAFVQRARQPELAAAVVDLLDGWVMSLTAGVTWRRPPRRIVLLEPEREVTLAARQAAGVARGGVVWVRHTQGVSWFQGKAELSLGAGDGAFPLASSGWLLAAEADTALHTAATRDELNRTEFWSGLQGFHQLVLAGAAGNAAELEAAEQGRVLRRAQSEALALRAAVARLAGAVAAPSDDAVEADVEPLGPVREEDALFAACRLVGARLGVAIRPPPEAGEPRRRSDPVIAIARASRVRLRRVRLADGWWREDHGPLLGFRAGDERPVALLQTSPTRYELIDPQGGTRTPATAANARPTEGAGPGLRPFGYAFYRPFPARSLTAWQLVDFALRGTWRDGLRVVLLGLAGSVMGLLTPIIVTWVFNKIVPAAEQSQLLVVVLALLSASIAAALFHFARGVAVLRLQTIMDGSVQAAIWDRLLNLPATFFRRYATGDLAMRALGVVAIPQVLTDAGLSVLLSFVFSLANFVLLFVYAPGLAGLAGLVLAAAVLTTTGFAWRQLGYQRRVYAARGKVAGLVLQLLTGIARLRLAGAEDRALAVWAQDFGVQKGLAYRARAVASNLTAFDAALPILGTAVVFAGVAALPQDTLSLGVFLAFIAAFTQMLAAAGSLGWVVRDAVQVVPLYERARPILEALPEADVTSADPGELSGDIELSHVSFRYQADGPLVLDDISVQIRAGEFVAFVGPSGAGKSTLLRLLLGFERPTAGSVYYDRLDLAGLDCQAVRRQVGVVLQDGKLLTGDLYSNIVGSSLMSQEDAWEAARLAGLDEDIARMPMGMQTVVSEGGSTLSGGQRQRLLIARAVAARPRILLLDEATSALDNETQAQVSRSLERLKATRVVIAHRLSTIQAADRICVLDGGRIVQVGRHDELAARPGLFKELVERQMI